MTATAAERTVHVWDVPTRVFHWGLLALVAIAWATGGEEGSSFTIHRLAGEAIAGLIVFRVIWGFVGGERARFADFAAGPGRVIAHVRDLFSGAPKRDLGHNPLGGIAVFLLMATVIGIVVTGLFAASDDAAGPFAGLAPFETGDLHEALFRVLQGLVVLHVLGVIVESVLTKDRLLPAMVTGRKTRRADEPGADARRAAPVAAIAAVTLGLATAVALQAAPAGRPQAEAGGGHESEDGAHSPGVYSGERQDHRHEDD